MRGIRHHFQKPNHGRVRRLIEMRDPLVQAIDRDRVLDEIVRADAEKIHFPRERFRAKGRARNLDHRAHIRFVG